MNDEPLRKVPLDNIILPAPSTEENDTLLMRTILIQVEDECRAIHSGSSIAGPAGASELVNQTGGQNFHPLDMGDFK